MTDTVLLAIDGPRATIRSRQAIPLQRPRRVLGSRQHPEFGRLVQQLWDDLEGVSVPPGGGGR